MAARDGYNPFAERQLDHPTSYIETLSHLVKSALGTGILGMPIAFMYVGWILGILMTILTAFLCTHCMYILVQCAHEMCYRLRKPSVTYAELVELSLGSGPKFAQKMQSFMSSLVLFFTFLTYFGTVSVYAVIVSKNLQQTLEHYQSITISTRMMLLILWGPLIALCLIPNLKFLAPVSMFALLCMFFGLLITFYYVFNNFVASEVSERKTIDFLGLPRYFAIAIFAMECIGVVLPLENNMVNPLQFLGLCGVLVSGMFFICCIYMVLGLFGYLTYGDNTEGSITLSLPLDENLSQSVKILISLAVFGSCGIQNHIALAILWNLIKDKGIMTRNPTFYNSVLRVLETSAAIALAIAIPTIAPFMGLIGALCFSILGLIVPPLIQIIIYWEEGFSLFDWVRSIFYILFGFGALIFGTYSSIEEIAELYK